MNRLEILPILCILLILASEGGGNAYAADNYADCAQCHADYRKRGCGGCAALRAVGRSVEGERGVLCLPRGFERAANGGFQLSR